MKKFVIISVSLVLAAVIAFGIGVYHYMKVKEPEKKETVRKAVTAPASQKGKQNKTPSEKEKDHEIKA